MRYLPPSFIFGNRFDNDLIGTDRRDLVFGFAGNDRIETKAGKDFVQAGKGNDIVDTGADDDIVFAGKGDDVVRTGAGNDAAYGGKGFDTAVYDEGIEDYEIELSANGKLVIVSSATASDGGRDFLRQFEALYFTQDDYTLYLDGTNNAVLAGDDAAATGENEVLTLQVADLLANDREFDGDTVSLVSVSGTSASGATVTLLNGSISYDPGTLFDGLAAGQTATDTFTYVVGDGRGGNDTATVTVTIVGEDDAPAIDARINEVHYDNAGTDTGEFLEIRTAAGDDVSALMVELLNGSNGTVYGSTGVAGLAMTSDGTWDYYVWSLPENGIQNGSPDGIVLANGGQVIEFLSYEGEFAATDGAAAGMTSTDIGVAETGDTPAGQSLQREEDGTWTGPRTETPGAENAVPAAQIVINEIMQNPDAVADSAGEWFELYNAGDTAVDINGWTVRDEGSDSFVIDNGGPLMIAAGGFLVLGNNADAATNGGVGVDYQYSGMFLANGDDELVLIDAQDREIDRVEYDGGPVFPDPTGASMALTDPGLDNNDGANWTTSDVPFGDGDLGTPGFDNGAAPAPMIVINEIMQNPDAVSDTDGEWFEVFNAGTTTVDMNGWTISDNGSDAHVIDNGGPLAIAPGAYLVFGSNGDMATNGGVAVDYVYSGITLANGDDEVVLTDGAGTEIDRVEYDGGPEFPDPTGASMALTDVAADNNVGTNWTTSDVPFGDGDLGTPGTGNTSGNVEMRLISEVQGAGRTSAFVGSVVQLDAIVTHTLSNGFLMQEEDADADADTSTSEGIFVFTGAGALPAVGDRVQVTGTVAEFFGETEIDSVTDLTVVSSGNALPTAATVTFPVASSVLNSDGAFIADLEAYEGMLVNLPQSFTISDLFTFGRFADIGLHQGGRLEIFTQSNTPDQAAFQAYEDLAVRNTIVIDDGSAIQNPAVIPFEVSGVSGNIAGQYDAADPLSTGDTASDITGVVRFTRGSGGSGEEVYRIIPTETLVIEDTNPQTDPPDVGGTITISSFNVLNFFTTLDDGSGTSGPDGLEPRGANNLAEFERQSDKLISALADIGADVFGLIEVENEFGDQNGDGQWSIQYIIDALNSDIPGAAYTFADPGTAFGDTGDAITVALIYNANTVGIADGTTVEYLTDADLAGLGLDFGNPVFDGSGTSRAPVAATFEEIASGEQFTVSVNHFKSKGSVSPFGDNAGTGDGTGNNNEARLQAATALDAWLDSNPTGTSDPDTLIIGDLNAYGMEDPVQFLLGQGYADQVREFLATGEFEYSFGFPVDLDTSPQVQAFGALDYALANGSLASQVTGAAEWHINADEAAVRDYNTEFKPPEQIDQLYSTDPFRASDHDPLIIGLDLGPDVLLM